MQRVKVLSKNTHPIHFLSRGLGCKMAICRLYFCLHKTINTITNERFLSNLRRGRMCRRRVPSAARVYKYDAGSRYITAAAAARVAFGYQLRSFIILLRIVWQRKASATVMPFPLGPRTSSSVMDCRLEEHYIYIHIYIYIYIYSLYIHRYIYTRLPSNELHVLPPLGWSKPCGCWTN